MYTFSQKLFVEMNFYEPKTSLIRPWLKVKLKLNTFFLFLEEILGSYLHKDFWDWKMLGYQ